jgi:hypothetical protein
MTAIEKQTQISNMTIIERLTQHYPNAVLWDNLNDAIIGISGDLRAVYDIDKMAVCLQTNNKWTEDYAYEWIHYSLLGVDVGKFTPIHIYTK